MPDFHADQLARNIHDAVRAYEAGTGKKVRAVGIALRPPLNTQWGLTVRHIERETVDDTAQQRQGRADDIFRSIFGER